MSDNLIDTVLKVVTPEIYQRFKSAIELKRWPNGVSLTGEQLDTCMQAVVAYEYKHTPETLRTGYVPPKDEPCDTDAAANQDPLEESVITWR